MDFDYDFSFIPLTETQYEIVPSQLRDAPPSGTQEVAGTQADPQRQQGGATQEAARRS